MFWRQIHKLGLLYSPKCEALERSEQGVEFGEESVVGGF